MKESETVKKFNELKKRAAIVGITLITAKNNASFSFINVPKVPDYTLFLYDLHDVDKFLHGYELGYRSS